MKILLTGFEPFGDLKVNPSQAILERITDGHTLCNLHDINTVILPVRFDSAGNGPKLILLGRPISYKSTLPLERIYRSLMDRNIPVTMSDDAGKYICNYVFYLACHQIKLLKK
ncbi:hypothetical protein BH18THE1_BH18THE1_12280 [soil metagenome]